jgi:hypothetical protein
MSLLVKQKEKNEIGAVYKSKRKINILKETEIVCMS